LAVKRDAPPLGGARRYLAAAVSNDDAPDRARHRGLGLAALGIVFGDTGTSPLYALRERLVGEHGVDL